MAGSTVLRAADVRSWIGRKVVGVARILYTFEGEVESDDGALEITFGDGSVLLFDSDGGQERLRVVPAPWIDPFEGPQTPENRAWLDAHGRWRRVDVSADPDYAWLCAEGIGEVEVLENEFGLEAGVRLGAGFNALYFFVRCDECHVGRERPAGATGHRPCADDAEPDERKS